MLRTLLKRITSPAGIRISAPAGGDRRGVRAISLTMFYSLSREVTPVELNPSHFPSLSFIIKGVLTPDARKACRHPGNKTRTTFS